MQSALWQQEAPLPWCDATPSSSRPHCLTSPASMSSRAVRCSRKLFSGKDVSALGMQLWLPAGKPGCSCEGVSRETGRQRQAQRPHTARGLVPALLCGPGMWDPVSPTGRAIAWLRIRQHQCCTHSIYLGDASVTLSHWGLGASVEQGAGPGLSIRPQKPLREQAVLDQPPG